jgi:hypothetical protein
MPTPTQAQLRAYQQELMQQANYPVPAWLYQNAANVAPPFPPPADIYIMGQVIDGTTGEIKR